MLVGDWRPEVDIASLYRSFPEDSVYWVFILSRRSGRKAGFKGKGAPRGDALEADRYLRQERRLIGSPAPKKPMSGQARAPIHGCGRPSLPSWAEGRSPWSLRQCI